METEIKKTVENDLTVYRLGRWTAIRESLNWFNVLERDVHKTSAQHCVAALHVPSGTVDIRTPLNWSLQSLKELAEFSEAVIKHESL